METINGYRENKGLGCHPKPLHLCKQTTDKEGNVCCHETPSSYVQILQMQL